MQLTRRSTIGLLAAGGAVAAYGGYVGFRQSRRGLTGPARPLAIPPLDAGLMQDGVRSFDLRLDKGVGQFFEGIRTPTFGINGDYLGPTLRLRAGARVRLNVKNSIGQSSTLH